MTVGTIEKGGRGVTHASAGLVAQANEAEAQPGERPRPLAALGSGGEILDETKS